MLYALVHRLTHPRPPSARRAHRGSRTASTARTVLRVGVFGALIAGSTLLAGVSAVHAAALADSTALVLAAWFAGVTALTALPRAAAWTVDRLLDER